MPKERKKGKFVTYARVGSENQLQSNEEQLLEMQRIIKQMHDEMIADRKMKARKFSRICGKKMDSGDGGNISTVFCNGKEYKRVLNG